MNFIWLFLAGITVLVFITLVMSNLIKNFQKRFPNCDSVPFMSGITVLISFLCIGLYFSWITNLTIPILCLYIALCALQLILLSPKSVMREVLILTVCCGSTFLIPTDGIFFKLFPSIISQLILGGLCYLMLKSFSFMDRINSYSLSRLFSLGILFILFFHIRFLPDIMQIPFFLLFISFIGIIQTSKAFTNGKTILGPFASALVGFQVSLFICYVISKGSFILPIALFALDITEVVLAAIMTFITTRRFYPLTAPLSIEQAYNKNFETKKLNRFIFFILLSQALLAFMFFNRTNLDLLLPTLLLLMICTEYRLKNWDRPIPTYKSMFSDIKQGVAELKKQANYIPLKEKTKQKTKKQGKTKK